MTKEEDSKKNTPNVFGVRVSTEKLAEVALWLLVFLLPLGTRFIFFPGEIGAATVEWGTVSVYATQILAAVFVTLAFFARRRAISWVASWSTVLLACVVILSTLRSDDLVWTFTSTAWWILLGLAVYLAVRLLRPDPRAMTGAFIASVAVQSVLAAVQFGFQAVWGSRWIGVASQNALIAGTSVVESGDGRWLRAYGTLSHPNILGVYCAVGLVLALWFVLRGKGKKFRHLAAVSLPIITLGLVFSFSRSAWVGAGFGIVVVLASSLRSDFAKRRVLAAAALSAIVMTVVGAVAVVPSPFLSRVTASGRLETLSVSQRVSAIEDAETLFSEHPLFGVGPGQMAYAVASEKPNRNGWSYQPVHLLPAIITVEIGLIGLFTWLLWLSWPCVVAYKPRRFYRLVDGPFAAALLAILIAGLFDHYAWTLWPGAALFFVLAGLSSLEIDRRGLPKRQNKA